MNKNTTFKNAKWLWPFPVDTPRNTYVQYRYNFSLKAVPNKAPFFITADQCYMLYVNGNYICRGPARGYQASWPYDNADLGPCLRMGHNWISVRVYNSAVSTFQYLHQSTGGFLCAADWGKIKIYSGSDWIERIEPGYVMNTERLSFQLNYQEWVDARVNDQAWITAAKVPEGNGWSHPSHVRPFGVMPWHSVEPRGIPNLTGDLLPYGKTAFARCGVCAKNWRSENNLYVPVYNELKKKKKWTSFEKCRKTKQGLIFQLPKAGKGKYSSVSVDMGRPCIGSLVVDAQGAAGGEIIDFFFTEGLFKDGSPIIGPELKSACSAAMVHRIELRTGKTRHELFQMMGHRYVVAIARETRRPIKLKLALRESIYPFDVKGGFESDTPVLNDIYRICVQTQRVCSLDSYVDTPWREQAQWWGDARVQAQNSFYLSDDARLLKRGIRSIARQELPNGLTFGHAPTVAYNCIMPDYSMIWAITIWDYYFQTGDIELFVGQLPRIQRLLGYFTGEGRAKNGLLKYDNRYWLFLDWTEIFRDGLPALLNLWYLYMLEKLAALAGVAGLDSEKRKFSAMYNQQKKLVLRYFWDSKAGLFRDGVDFNGKAIKQYSIHTQTLGIICGLLKSYHSNMVTSLLLPYLKGERVESALLSSYWVTYVYEVMTKLGFGREVLEHIHNHWSPMIPWGGTWEAFPKDKAYEGDEENCFEFGRMSMTHAWAAHPIYHLPRTLGGVTQTDVAWKRVRFAPTLGAMDTEQVKVAIPTPQGKITSSWRRVKGGDFEVTLALPKGVSADVVLKGIGGSVTGKTKWRVKV